MYIVIKKDLQTRIHQFAKIKMRQLVSNLQKRSKTGRPVEMQLTLVDG